MTDPLTRNLLRDRGGKFGTVRPGLPRHCRLHGHAGLLRSTSAELAVRIPAAGIQDHHFFFDLDFDFFFETFLFTAFLWAFFAMFNSPSLRVVSASEYLFPRSRSPSSNSAGSL
jgi:hypothetical protein